MGSGQGPLENLVDLQNKKIFLIGGSGFLGLNIAKFFSTFENLHITLGFYRNKPLIEDLAFRRNIFVEYVNLDDLNSLTNVISGSDILINLASVPAEMFNTKPYYYLIKSMVWANNIKESLKKNKIKKLINISSIHVYGNSLAGQINENTKCQPSSFYGLSHKLKEDIFESLTFDHQIEVINIRLSNVLGPSISPSYSYWKLVQNDFAFQVANSSNIKLKSEGNEYRDFISLKNVLAFLKLITETNFHRSEVFNLVSGNAISIIELAKVYKKVAFEKFGKDILIFHKKSKLTNNKNYFVFSQDKMNKIFTSEKQFIEDEVFVLIKFAENFLKNEKK